MTQVNLVIAFLAGLASFFAPCVVPLVPAYISFISGVSFSSLVSNNSGIYKRRVLLNSISYVLGFSIVFVLLGLGATTLGQQLIGNRDILLKVGGGMVILFGLAVLGVFNTLPLANREFRINLPGSARKLRYLGPFLLGTTFALAWTPCVGAILGAILTLAATSKSLVEGGTLLFIYSMGITAPFLLIALTLSRSHKLLIKLGPGLRYLTWVSGALLIISGFLMLTQNYTLLTGYLFNQFSHLSLFKIQ